MGTELYPTCCRTRSEAVCCQLKRKLNYFCESPTIKEGFVASLKADKSKESGTSGARGKRPGSAGGHRDKGRRRLVHTWLDFEILAISLVNLLCLMNATTYAHINIFTKPVPNLSWGLDIPLNCIWSTIISFVLFKPLHKYSFYIGFCVKSKHYRESTNEIMNVLVHKWWLYEWRTKPWVQMI